MGRKEGLYQVETSAWSIYSGVSQGSVLGLLFFLVCINNLYQYQSCDVKIFDTSMFPVIENDAVTADGLS